MNRSNKILKNLALTIVLLLSFALIAITGKLVFWFVEEQGNYQRYSEKLEKAAANIKTGANYGEIEIILGKPDIVNLTNPNGKIYVHWFASKHQGYLHEKLGFFSYKGHIDLTIQLDEEMKAEKVWSGIN